VASSGLIEVRAGQLVHGNSAQIDTNGGAFGLAALSETLPRAKVGGSTVASFGGNATSGSGLTVTADSDNNTTVTVKTLSIGLFSGALTKSYARVTSDSETRA